MSVRLPIYTQVGMDGFQMYPGLPDRPGIHHDIEPGLHLVAGVNGLGKTSRLNGSECPVGDDAYADAVTAAMNVGSFADVLVILNLIVFMFESRELLMWSPSA